MTRDVFCPGFKLAAITSFLLSFIVTVAGRAQAPSFVPQVVSVNAQRPGTFALGRQNELPYRRLASQRAPATAHTASSSSGIMETLAGAVPFQQPETALTANLGAITGVAADAQGNVFVASTDFRCVLKIDASGNVTVYAGQPLPSGPLQASGDNGPATAATFVQPQGLAVDAAGNLYITDPNSYAIRKVTASTGIITTIAGTLGQSSSGTITSGILAVNALLSYPTSIALDPSGNIFFTDEEAIFRIDQASGLLTQYSGTNNSCQVLSDTQTCSLASIQITPNFYTGALAIKNGTLYVAAYYVVAGYNFFTGSLLAVDLSTGTTKLLAGGGYEASSPDGNALIGTTIDPLSVAVDANGNLDFAEGTGLEVYGASTIMQLPVNGTSLTTIAGTGQVGSTGDGGSASSAEIFDVVSIASAPSGNILLAEPYRVRSIDTSGNISTYAGNGTDNYFGDGGPAQSAGISTEDSVVDAQGNVYLADVANGVIRRIDGSTGTITTIAGNGGFADYVQNNSTGGSEPGDGGPATATPLGNPAALALGANNTLYIGDSYQGVRILNLSTGIITTLNSQLAVSGTMAFDGQHTLYAPNHEYVDALDTTTGAATVIAGNGSTAYGSGYGAIGDGGPATSAYLFPMGLATDGSGNLYISDSLEQGIRVVNLSTGIITLYAGPGYPAPAGYSGDGGPANAATFDEVGGLHYDGHGNLLLADRDNHAIRDINLTANIVNTVAGDGSAGYSGDSGVATSATLNFPTSASADASGNLYIADFYNDRLRRVVLQPAMLTAALATSTASATLGDNI
jgi:trimeric autotransporter adhesin